ncbi:MAG: hypothetical protein ACREX8_02940, partial [Gammaproteobacteria bacterium]
LLHAIRNEAGDIAVKQNRIAHSQARLLGGLDHTAGGRFMLDAVARSPANKIQGASVFAQTGKVLGKIPYVGLGLTAWQVQSEIRQGKPADQAVGSAAFSTIAGAGVTGLILTYAPIAVAGGPFTLAAVGVGMVAAWGVGYVVDHHWDDMKDTTGDTVEAIGGGASTAARKVGEWLG